MRSISSRGPPYAAAGSPPPTTLPMTTRSGVTPVSSWAPPRATRKPVITSSNTSSAPVAVARSRSSSRNPSAGGTRPMFAANGSQMIAAKSCVSVAARTASASFHATITVFAVAAAGTPGLAGSAWVASPLPASASRPSRWPW
jgi:hypothetical protein